MVEVKSTNGDTHLGGDDIDHKIVDWLVAEFKKDQGIDVGKDRMAIQRLQRSGGKGQDRALADSGDRYQSAVPHCRCLRAKAHAA